MKANILRLSFLQFLLFFCVLSISAEDFPAWYSATKNLNIRTTPSKQGGKIATVAPNTRLQVKYVRSDGWAVIDYNGRTAYCYAKYLSYREPVRQQERQSVTYNMVVHCFFETINYLIEVVVPSNDREGGDDNFVMWTLLATMQEMASTSHQNVARLCIIRQVRSSSVVCHLARRLISVWHQSMFMTSVGNQMR